MTIASIYRVVEISRCCGGIARFNGVLSPSTIEFTSRSQPAIWDLEPKVTSFAKWSDIGSVTAPQTVVPFSKPVGRRTIQS
jgi:hypothetical protein